jgi:uncharacterized protein (DUF1800 family)
MNRKEFLSLLSPSAVSHPAGTVKLLSGLDPYTGTWDTPQIAHLLRRTGFGAKKTDIELLRTMTVTQAVDYILTLPALPAPPVNNYNGVVNDPNVPLGQTWVNQPIDFTNPILINAQIDSLRSWWIGLMINEGPHIREKMTLFWHNHFATEANVVSVGQALYMHYTMLRTNCLGNFKNLTKLVTLDVSMLRYLNGYANSAAAPDENYARELQELFTVGKGPDSLYTEDDVKEAAKILTGYRINLSPLGYYFNPAEHTQGNKTFSSFYNGTTISGQTGLNGQQELDALLNMIFATEECAKHICRSLYRFFVYYKIDATIEANVITPLAEIFRNSGYEILPTLDALFKSQHFFDTMSLGCVIKNPLDYTVGLCREFNISIPNSSQVALQYTHWSIIYYYSAQMNMNIGDPPVVSGWPAYYQQPMFHEIWIDSDTIAKRIDFADRILTNGISANGATIIIDPIAYVSAMDAPADPNELLNEAVEYLYGIEIGPNAFAYLKSFLLSGQSQDYYWTDAWIAYTQDPADPTNYNIVQTRLKALFKYMLQQAEYHLS